MEKKYKLQEIRTLRRNLTEFFSVVAFVDNYCTTILKKYLNLQSLYK